MYHETGRTYRPKMIIMKRVNMQHVYFPKPTQEDGMGEREKQYIYRKLKLFMQYLVDPLLNLLHKVEARKIKEIRNNSIPKCHKRSICDCCHTHHDIWATVD